VNRLVTPAIARAELPFIALGALSSLVVTTSAARFGSTLSLGALVAVAFFLLAVVAFVAAPHAAVACTIPIFALIPMVKVLLFPGIGPLKDVIALAAISAAVIVIVHRAHVGEEQRGDALAAAGVGIFATLYVLNAGALEWNVAWFHGVRLALEPLALLLVGMTLYHPGRTLRWALASLVATAVFVALVGLFQQVVGEWRLHDYGYEFRAQLRTYHGHLRSFGTLDDPFTYAGFLLLGLAAVIFWVRTGVLAVAAGAVIVAGVAASLVRTALLVGLALLGLWLARRRHATTSVFLMILAVIAAIGVLVVASRASEERTVRKDESSALTINGRTEAWKLFLGDPRVWALGHGVGKVGTAADRATYTITRDADEAGKERAVDSGYFAVIADVGLVGLAVLLAVFGRLFTVAARAARRGASAAWVALALLSVLMTDAVTRASFTGFPTAFLALLLVGIALAAAAEERSPPAVPQRPRRPAARRPGPPRSAAEALQ
jgi:hypothetical protein